MDNSPLKELITRYPVLAGIEDKIVSASETLIRCFEEGNKLLLCGNGGSSSDCDHITGELLKGFEHKRPLDNALAERLAASGERGGYIAGRLQHGFPAISLSAHTALLTAFANDVDPSLVYAQQVAAFGKENDVLLALSTSGNSLNIIDAVITARAMKMRIIGMTGDTGGNMASLCDILLNVPGKRTMVVQELHFPIYHALCLAVERHFFK